MVGGTRWSHACCRSVLCSRFVATTLCMTYRRKFLLMMMLASYPPAESAAPANIATTRCSWSVANRHTAPISACLPGDGIYFYVFSFVLSTTLMVFLLLMAIWAIDYWWMLGMLHAIRVESMLSVM